MSEQTPRSASASSLPDAPDLDWLRKQAKRRLDELRSSNPSAKLADAHLALARQYGFSSWRALKAHIDSLSLDGQLFAAAKSGAVAVLTELLDRHPDKLEVRNQPYEHTLLHVAAFAGQLEVVDVLLRLGIDVNAREKGDNTYAMHWAAAAGHTDVVRRLAEAGGDVIGRGDDHELEVIGWATCWEGCDDASHHAVVQVLLEHGAHHHLFSAIALNLADEVRRIVAVQPAALNQRMSRNENNQLPLQFAVGMNRPAMVELLLQLGADPLGVDGSGQPAALYATAPNVDRPAMEAVRALTAAELDSARRGNRPPRTGAMDLLAALALQDFESAETLVRANPDLIERGQTKGGVLHMLAKRGDLAAVKWLLEHGANPNALWAHWDAEVTPLHLAILGGHAEVVRALLRAGADPAIRDSKHDGDALGWAEHFGRPKIVEMMKAGSK
jgi:ankyrin repeat protein